MWQRTTIATFIIAAKQILSAPDHVDPNDPYMGNSWNNPAGFGLNSGAGGNDWNTQYQNSLAQINEAYNQMNDMYGGESSFGQWDSPSDNGYGNPQSSYDQAYNQAYNSANDYNSLAELAGLSGTGFARSGPTNNINGGSTQNSYGTYGQSYNSANSNSDGYNPYGSTNNSPYDTSNQQGSNNQYTSYNTDNENSGKSYGGISMDDTLPDIEEDCWKNITDRINGFFIDKFPTLPSGESAYTNIEILSCYGCWCNRDQFFGRGMGEPRDAFDAICKFHHQAYECIEIDAEMRGEVCDPTETSQEGFRFKMELSFHEGRGGMNLQCDQTQSWCKQRVCEADLQYIKDFVRTALAGHRVRRDLYGHDDHIGIDGLPTGYFDSKLECPLGGSLHTPYKKCCGAYPRRRVFKTDVLSDGTGSYRQCCDLENGDNTGATEGAVFYPNSQVCCNEQGVQNGDTCELYEAL